MQLDVPHPDVPGRLRLVDIRVDADRGHLHFGAHLSGVLAPTGDRTAAAHRIATTVAGPRAESAGGSVEIDGEVVSVWALPATLLPEGAPVVIDRAVVHAQWQTWLRAEREKVAAAHASCRLEGYRIDAALEQARDRLPLPGAPIATTEPLGVRLAPAPEPERSPVREANGAEAEAAAVDWAEPPDATTRTRAKLRTLLEALDGAIWEPLPEGALLADAWDAHSVLLRARAAADELPGDDAAADIEALEQRVNAARAAIESAPRGVTDAARLRIEQCHRVVVEAETEVFEAKRKRRAAAQERYDAAVADELVVLVESGFDSYAAFLFEITGGNPTANLAARLAAETELAVARRELDAARQVPSVPTRVELAEREGLMRVRATELLGHPPGADPAAELRALLVDPSDRDETIAEIADVLDHGGIPCADDPVGRARAFVAESPPAPRPVLRRARKLRFGPDEPMNPLRRAAREAAEAWGAPLPGAPAVPTPAANVPGGTVDPARWREVADLEEQRAAQNRKLAAFEAELARIDQAGNAAVARLAGPELVRALEGVLAAYRDRALLGGRLPVILDGVLDGLASDARDAALQLFVRAADVQTVVVTDDPEVMQHLAREGGTLVRWPERIVDLTEERALDPTPTRAV